jgi:hydrogenase nickel incorporation protein HypB
MERTMQPREVKVISVFQDLRAANDQIAAANRAAFEAAAVRVVNVLGSPGAGKTSLIEATARSGRWAGRIGVIEGDLATANDAQRIAALDVPVVQINTGGGCHLNAKMVASALPEMDLGALDLLLIENVGNLVCPASFDLGESLRVVVSSTAEGADKPAKYPVIFRDADLVVLTKTDLLAHTDFDPQAFARHVADIQADLPILHLSCRSGTGVDAWLDWLSQRT